MRFVHDCEHCKPLGTFKEADLYFCNKLSPTVIARFGDEGWDYTSGLELSHLNEYLHEAKKRAVDHGFLRES